MTCEDGIADSIRARHPNWPVKRRVAEIQRRMKTECPREYEGERRRVKASKGRRRKGGPLIWDHTHEKYGGTRRKRRASSPAGRKRTTTKSWPRKASRKMGHVVAGVEARVHEDVTKALKILKSAKYRSQATAKRAGARKASGYSVLDKIVRELERLLTR